MSLGLRNLTIITVIITALFAAIYLPALWMILRRPNEGTVPAWLERASAVLPSWLRGRSSVAEAAAP